MGYGTPLAIAQGGSFSQRIKLFLVKSDTINLKKNPINRLLVLRVTVGSISQIMTPMQLHLKANCTLHHQTGEPIH